MSTLRHRHRRAGHQRPGAGRRPAGHPDATPRSSSSDGARRLGRARRGRARRRRAGRRRRPGRDPRLRRQPRPPGLRRRPGRRVRRPDGRRAATTAAASRTTVAATRAATDDELRGPAAPAASPRCAAPGHHDHRDQERLRADRRRRGPLPAARRARSPPETTFLGAHVVPAEYADRADDYVGLVTGADARRLRPARPVGRRVLRAGVAHASTATRPAPSWTAGRAAGLGLRVHANQLGRRPGRAARRRARRRQRRPLHPPDRRRRRRARRRRRRSRPCCPAWSSPPARPYPDARRLLDAGVTVALATDCNPGSSLHLVDAVLHRAGGPGDADDAGRGAVGGHRRRRARRCAATDVGRLAPGARADLAVLDAPSYLHLAYRPGVPLVHALELPAVAP